MVVHCEPFLQERYLLLRIKADPQSRLILFQSWCDVVGISGVKGLGVERHIQDCCVLVSSLSVLVIQSYHNPPSSISRVNPCNVRLQLRSISDESGVKLPLAIIIQLSTLTLTRQPTRHYQLSTTNYCLFTILISEHHRKSELPLGCFSVSAIGIILSETVKSAIIKSQSV